MIDCGGVGYQLQVSAAALSAASAAEPVWNIRQIPIERVSVVAHRGAGFLAPENTMSALELCDLALVPVVPSPTDLWATRGIERLILDRQQQRPALRGALLPNRVMRTALAGDVLDVLQDFELPVLDVALSQRSAYALSAVRGTSVFGLGRAAAAAQEEVEQLVSAVLGLIEG